MDSLNSANSSCHRLRQIFDQADQPACLRLFQSYHLRFFFGKAKSGWSAPKGKLSNRFSIANQMNFTAVP